MALRSTLEVSQLATMNYAKELIRLRTKAKLTQYGLAKAAGISQTRLANYEKEARKLPRDVFFDLLRILGYTLEEKIKKI